MVKIGMEYYNIPNGKYMNKINYNIKQFNFKQKLQEIFKVDELSELNDNVEVFTREKDQSTNWHKLFYEWARTEEFIQLYDEFIAQVVKPLYNEIIVYQVIPTFRVCYPNNIAVGEFHKDKHYRNGDWATKVQEDNFFLPFTDAFDTNTIWVETEEDKKDFYPMDCEYGELIQWDGCNLMHGNKLNTTGQARVSMDFRVIRYKNYIPSQHSSINTKIKFQIGGYYKLM
jgi:ectoine hydroxylase-related dioxygenase (phytanoyl-CoA dioxygenase family)